MNSLSIRAGINSGTSVSTEGSCMRVVMGVSPGREKVAMHSKKAFLGRSWFWFWVLGRDSVHAQRGEFRGIATNQEQRTKNNGPGPVGGVERSGRPTPPTADFREASVWLNRIVKDRHSGNQPGFQPRPIEAASAAFPAKRIRPVLLARVRCDACAVSTAPPSVSPPLAARRRAERNRPAIAGSRTRRKRRA